MPVSKLILCYTIEFNHAYFCVWNKVLAGFYSFFRVVLNSHYFYFIYFFDRALKIF